MIKGLEYGQSECISASPARLGIRHDKWVDICRFCILFEDGIDKDSYHEGISSPTDDPYPRLVSPTAFNSPV